jgi:hypothetical protein
MNFLVDYALLFFKYTLLYFYFYLSGRSIVLAVTYFFKKELKTPEEILYVKKEYLYPIIGAASLGNFFIILHFFIPLKSSIYIIFSLLLILPNIFLKPKEINIKLSLQNFIFYILIPAILIISSYDTTWHYDAGYYHLNHQNLLRESNMIIGSVNIFWAYGMSSIYEYISAFLWIDTSFILIHFLTLIFIQTFYIYLIANLENSKYKELKFVSYFILVYSLFDNFGINGGRNGFLYIQGVTKQDMPVAVLIVIVSLSCLLILKHKKIKNIDIFTLFLISLFVVQIKLSSVVIGYLLLIVLVFMYRNKIKTFKEIISSIFLILPFLTAWIVKGYFTTGCFLFPLSSTCINNFDWYPENSTRSMESVTTNSSYGLIEYLNQSISILDWWNILISFRINMTVMTNFLVSFLVVYFLKKILFRAITPSRTLMITIFSFITLYFVYLFLYGPTPRYATGLLILSIASMAFFVDDFKFKINKKVSLLFYIFSIVLLIRSSSYAAFLSGSNIAIFDPVIIAKYQEAQNGWVIPDEGDQCWINLKCTMEKQPATIIEENFYKTAYKK